MGDNKRAIEFNTRDSQISFNFGRPSDDNHSKDSASEKDPAVDEDSVDYPSVNSPMIDYPFGDFTVGITKKSMESEVYEFGEGGVLGPKGSVAVGTNFDEIYAGVSVEDFFLENNGDEQVKAGLILDDGDLKPYVSGEISHDKNIEIEGISARFKAAAAFIPGESPYAYVSAGLRYDRPEDVDSQI